MAPSRNRKSDLDTLKGQAEELWDDQREILERANRVVRQASRHARGYARDEASSRLHGAVHTGRGVVGGAREHLVDDVAPAVSSAMTTALGSALAIIEAAKDPNVRAALKRASSAGTAVATRAGIVKPKSSAGVGRYILIGVGIVAAAGIAYAAWQTLRADDDLWIDDEELTEQSGDVQPS
jgi:hypothetical protein